MINKQQVEQILGRFGAAGILELKGFHRGMDDGQEVVVTGMTAKGLKVLALKGWRLRWWSFWWDRRFVWMAEWVL